MQMLNPRLTLCLFIASLLSSTCFGQLHNYNDYISSKPALESNDFIIWSGDTLNRKDAGNIKMGMWLEYKKEYIIDHTTASVLTDLSSPEDIIEKVDTLGIQYRITAIGKYDKGKRSGEWLIFYKNKNLKAILNFIQGKLNGEAKIFYNKWPTTVKFEGKISNVDAYTDFKYYDRSGKFIHLERFKIYKLLDSIE